MSALDALQDALAAEHAAVHVLAVLAAQAATTDADPETPATAGPADPATLTALAAARHALHLSRRDELVAQLRAREAEPVAAAAAYELPALGTQALVRAAGALVEQRCLTGYADLVARTTGRLRSWAVDALLESATAVLDWGGDASAFPGADEL